MSISPECEHARDLAPEVALGIASGEERARVLGHIARCTECKQIVGELGEIADGLLLLTPDAEPPAGFESRTLERMEVKRERRSWLLTAAAAVVVAAVAAGAVLLVTRDDRRLAAEYGRVLHEADGSYFGARSVRDPQGDEAGDLFLYNGDHPWMLVAFDEGMTPGAYRSELMTHEGQRIALGSFELGGDDLEWGTGLNLDLRSVHSAHFVSEDSGEAYTATFGEH